MTIKKNASIFRHPNRYAKTVEYVKKCVEICWLMAVQDPPMAFGPLPRFYDWFDSNLYKPYTKSGRKVDFVVWPVLYLHDNGSVICKGILEPIKQDEQDYQYTVMRDNNTKGRYEESRPDQYSARTSVSPSDIRSTSIKEDDLHFSPSREILSNSGRTRRDIGSERSFHHRNERVIPSYQQETFRPLYSLSPGIYMHHNFDIRNSDILRKREKYY